MSRAGQHQVLMIELLEARFQSSDQQRWHKLPTFLPLFGWPPRWILAITDHHAVHLVCRRER